ncbi:Adenosine 5'-monophosphoramidase [Ciborinia camelliae]|nr:Adenosine 5'-monophosphoramidase [Ciborinia camelliae]
MASQAACIFCKIIKGDIPSFKLYESEKVFAFLDINPLSRGHALVVPKFHGEKLVEIPDDQLTEILNNGRIAHQEVDHVHFHMIPKPSTEEGMTIGWPQQKTDMDQLKALFAEIQAKM